MSVEAPDSRRRDTAVPIRRARQAVAIAIAAALLTMVGAGSARVNAQVEESLEDRHDLTSRLTLDVLATVYPDADRIGPTEGIPPAAPVYKDDEIVAYLYSTLDVVAAPGYSSVPFDVIGGIDLDGVITGAKVIFHREPYVIGDEVRQVQLDAFLASHNGYRTRATNTGLLPPDMVSSATVTARAMRGGVIDSARLVLRERVPMQVVDQPTLDTEGFRPTSWEQLLDDGSVVHRRISNAEVAELFEKSGGAAATPAVPLGPRDDTFIDIYAGLVDPPAIGRNLFQARTFETYLRKWPEEGHIIAVAADGVYDFKGNAFYRESNGYQFDRVWLEQDDTTVRFTKDNFQRVGSGGTGIRSLPTAALFYLPADSGFDPLRPWRLVLHVDGAEANAPVAVDLELPYELPARHVLMPPPEPVPAWVEAWQDSAVDIGILTVTLIVLTALLIFQTQLTRSPRVHRWVRNGFLAFVLIWLGGIAGAQLSIVNVVNYMLAPFRDFDWGFYLAEPLILLIAVYTAISLVLLGRGVFCGWLCPFGALQELLAQVARALRLPQWNPGEAVQKRLWAVKYGAAAVVLVLAFISVESATTASEIEPFKTVITAKFSRSWPFVLYALALLAAGLFTERAFCRFLCPLGGTLAVLGRFHLFNNLKRRPECGSPCQLCAVACPVKVIARSGEIDMNECFQCLDCQVEYADDRRCPPLVKDRKRRESGLAGPLAPTPAPVMARTADPAPAR